MAVVSVNGAPLAFVQGTFDQLAADAGAKFGNKLFKSELEGLRALLTRAAPPVQPQEIVFAIRQMAMDKRQKYKRVIDYVVFNWPHMVAGGLTAVADPRSTYGTTFAQEYGMMLPAQDNVDLIYGATAGRGLPPYTGLGARICDNFNNAANIGTGLAFGRAWGGQGVLNATVNSATQVIQLATATPGLVDGISQATRQAHVNGLMASRMDPTRALTMPKSKLKKDLQKTGAQIQAANMLPANDSRIEKHMFAHARMVKGVRRACKGGIAMVASLAGYRAVNAKVHFILDALGDLGALAMKEALHAGGDYVAITTSELDFCHRYWNDPVYPLAHVVKFYVNGDRVIAPWEGDWQINDFNGNPVTSNEEAWRRYSLAHDLRSVRKPFPRF
jgi:hypothetical protein